ncbi:MAG TPA: chemotaxis protein CheW [Anaeromyxobacteraceae bacterium]|nr:chemotaxis protein CheW [Anaeromyxobacteraceae bacterium]
MSPAPSAHDDGAPSIAELVIFRVGSEEYAVDVRRVREVVAPLPVRRMPRVPEFMEGVADLRGEIIPVIDVRRRFGLHAGTPTRKTKLMVVHMGGSKVGLVVDAVLEVMRVSRAAIRPAPPLAGRDAPGLFLGVVGAHSGGRPGREGRSGLKFLLNVKGLLDPMASRDMEKARALASKAAEP